MAKQKPRKPATVPPAPSETGFAPSLPVTLIVLVALAALVIPLLSRLYSSPSDLTSDSSSSSTSPPKSKSPSPSTPASTLYCLADPALKITTSALLRPKSSRKAVQCFRVSTATGRFTELLPAFPSTAADMHGIVYLPGNVLPGLIDGHGHVLQYGEMLESVTLYGASSMQEVRDRIKAFLKQRRTKPDVSAAAEGELGSSQRWIRGVGWDQKFFGGVMPTADDLSQDPELAGLYIMLDRVDVHCVLVSQPILDLLPSPLPPSPPGGEIITTPGPGTFCDNAMDDFIYPLAPIPSIATKRRWFRRAFAELNKVGITGVGDAGMRAADVAILETMLTESESDALPVRISVMLECTTRNTFCPDEVAHLALLRGPLGAPTPSLLSGGVKLFADGALGSWGAALLQPYSDKATTSGTMLINETSLRSVVQEWYDAGFQVNVHAIGDRANRAAVDAFTGVLCPDRMCDCDRGKCNEQRRLRIEHAQIIDPSDQWRLRRLGIIPSIQPTHATSDMAYAGERLGDDRLANSAYRMRSLFQSADPDATLRSGYTGPVLGSDFPVEPPNPFAGMYAAVTRKNPALDPGDDDGEGWYADEALSVEQALLGFTRNAAYGWFREKDVGAIKVGMWADWVVVDRDIFADETGKSLRDVEVRQTWVGGKKVFDNEETERKE